MHPELFGVVCLIDAWLALLSPEPPLFLSKQEIRDAIGDTEVHLPCSPCAALSSFICFHGLMTALELVD